MIFCNTRFCVSNNFDRHKFFDLLCKQFLRQTDYDADVLTVFKSFDFCSDELHMSSIDESEKIDVSNYDDVFILSCISSHNGIVLSSYYVLYDKAPVRSMHVLCERSYADLHMNDNVVDHDLPELFQSIFWNEFGGQDDLFLTTNLPYMLKRSDVDMAKRIFSGDINTLLPVVYVSRNLDNLGANVDCNTLSELLAGQAHVVVESSPVVSQLISDSLKNSDIHKPYNGFISVCVKGSANTDKSQQYSPDETAYTIASDIRQRLSNTLIEDEYNAVKIRQQHALAKLGDDNELSQLFESMLKDKEREIDSLRSEVSEFKKLYNEERNKNDALKSHLDKSDAKSDKALQFSVTESELYDGELSTVVLKILQKEYDLIKDDPRCNRGRKFDVLSDILNHNFPRTTDAELVECLRSAFNDGTLTRNGIGCLQASGFTVVKGGNDHYKIYIGDESRYFITVSCTPSDRSRSVLNLISDFSNRLFS